MRIMDNAVTYGICQCRIADNVMPRVDRELTGNESSSHIMSIVDNEAPILIREGQEMKGLITLGENL